MVLEFRRWNFLPKKSRMSGRNSNNRNRSVSPQRTAHPLIDQIKNQIPVLKAWESSSNRLTGKWICDGLIGLKCLNDLISHLLQLPHSVEYLHWCPDLIEMLLNDYLLYIDVYKIFQSILLAFRDRIQCAQVGIRCQQRDLSSMHSFVKQIQKQMKHLISRLRGFERDHAQLHSNDDLTLSLIDIKSSVLAVSTMIFPSVLGIHQSRSLTNLRWRLKKGDRINDLEEGSIKELGRLATSLYRMKDLEDSIHQIELQSERFLRSLVSVRAYLLTL